MQKRVETVEMARLRAEEALRQRDTELFAATRAQHAACSDVGRALAHFESEGIKALQRVEATLERRTQQARPRAAGGDACAGELVAVRWLVALALAQPSRSANGSP